MLPLSPTPPPPDALIVIDFTATWCGPCKMIAPFYAALPGDHPGVIFCKVDVDEAAEVAGKYDVR